MLPGNNGSAPWSSARVCHSRCITGVAMLRCRWLESAQYFLPVRTACITLLRATDVLLHLFTSASDYCVCWAHRCCWLSLGLVKFYFLRTCNYHVSSRCTKINTTLHGITDSRPRQTPMKQKPWEVIVIVIVLDIRIMTMC